MEKKQWDITDSSELYRVREWGEEYFYINKDGHLCLNPTKSSEATEINIYKIVKEVQQSQIALPLVIRFHDVLRSRVVELNETFIDIITEARYQGKYKGVYPVKVNQMREVVEEIVDAGKQYHYGLEAGSKAELMAALALEDNENGLTIINGYKDKDYLQLALLGRKIGKEIIVVIEKFSELPKLLNLAEEMNAQPLIGIRAKLTTKGSGKWAESTGEQAKFGLTIPEILKAIKYLEEHNQLQNLRLFHYHIGSQIPDIKTIKDSLYEAARIFAQLVKLGAPLQYFDVGGGLGVNYEGLSANATGQALNYSLRDYISDVVYIIKDICDQEDVAHPHLVSESGRAVAAHHSCIITDVFGVIHQGSHDHPHYEITGTDHNIIKGLWDIYRNISEKNLADSYNDAIIKKEDFLSAFKLGVITLEQRGKAEILFSKILQKICEIDKQLCQDEEDDRNFAHLDPISQYLCNFSVFQSTPDSWAIGQVLPIMPISRLNEQPTQKAIIADITCDSDGKIDRFISDDQVVKTTYFHGFDSLPPKDYYIGIFMTGAYQDIMGDTHNLFGRLNEIHVYQDHEDPDGYYIETSIRGNSADQILSTVQYSSFELAKTIKQKIDKAVRQGKLKPREGVHLSNFYQSCLNSYTYLNSSPSD